MDCTLKGGLTPALREKSEKFTRDAERLLILFPNDIREIFVMQECEFKKAKKSNPELRKFCKDLRPLRHLNFCEAFRGQISEVYILKFDSQPDVKMISLDCNAIFPGEICRLQT